LPRRALPATPGRHRIGADLAEEVAACLLGGYGLPHHVGLAAFEAVDLVVIFEQETPLELIKRVKPSVLIKGADYRLEDVVGRKEVEAAGGDVILVDLVPGQSTTGLVRRSAQSAPRPLRSLKPAKS